MTEEGLYEGGMTVGPVLSTRDIERMRESGRINGNVHCTVRKALVAGITTMELNDLAAALMRQAGAVSSIRDGYGFPGDICISVNEEIGHGIPGKRRLQNGDIVKVDVSIAYEGVHTDAARTHTVGTPTHPDVSRMLNITVEALSEGIAQAVAGTRCSDISHAISNYVQTHGLTVVRHAFGHGIGRELHQAPSVANFGPPNLGPRIRAGMALAIEPVVCLGLGAWGKKKDGWTEVTLDGQVSAHEEHTILVTEGTPEVLTQMTDDSNECTTIKGEGHSLDSQYTFPGSVRPRLLEESDKPAIIRMAAAAMDPVLMAAWGRKVTQSDLFPVGGETRVLVGDTNEALGFFTVEPREMERLLHLTTLVIDAAHRGTGLGQAVMANIERMARVDGFPMVQLCVQTTNPRAIRFYERQGYHVCGEPYPNTLLMQKAV